MDLRRVLNAMTPFEFRNMMLVHARDVNSYPNLQRTTPKVLSMEERHRQSVCRR